MSKSKHKRVAVLGATGLVGRVMMDILEERYFPVGEFVPIASGASRGTELTAFGRKWPVVAAEDADFDNIDYCLCTAGAAVSREVVPRAVDAGCRVIDNTTAFRMDDRIPLVVPEINGSLITPDTRLISSPNCTAIILVLTLAPLVKIVPVTRVVLTSFQSVSGTGKSALDELMSQSRSVIEGEDVVARVYPKQIAFNCLPQIGELSERGYSDEEEKIIAESRKILSRPDLHVVPTTVRVPVRVGHAISVNVELGETLTIESFVDVLRRAPGVNVADDLPTPIDGAGEDVVYVGRIRRDESRPCAFSYWVVGDNLRKGAATNCVQIAELMTLE